MENYKDASRIALLSLIIVGSLLIAGGNKVYSVNVEPYYPPQPLVGLPFGTSTEPLVLPPNPSKNAKSSQKKGVRIEAATYNNPILELAKYYVSNFGYKPMWSGAPLDGYSPVPEGQVDDVVARLISCESGDVNGGCGVDTNGKLSCGIGQFQNWQSDWEAASGISGDPNYPPDAVKMMVWGVENGRLDRWTCARKLGIAE